ncbi:hypothetical protein LJC17_01415 [Acholeplasma sp. OttesenSCG-928-E16]|nr:hypothetical protein [Acholeplasma sp. OttesenSCG-928-E16]
MVAIGKFIAENWLAIITVLSVILILLGTGLLSKLFKTTGKVLSVIADIGTTKSGRSAMIVMLVVILIIVIAMIIIFG